MGLRGQHVGSFEAAHEFARDRARFAVDHVPAEERYDLVVVGGGISGLAAAWFYRRAAGAKARILILDNHDDFGGHAKRNEFTDRWSPADRLRRQPVDRTRRRANGATSPRGCCAISVSMCDGSRRRSSATSIRRLVFRVACSCRASISAATCSHPAIRCVMSGNATTRRPANAKPLREFVAGLPLSEGEQEQLLGLYSASRDPLEGKSDGEKRRILKSTSYRDYLIKICGCSENVANCFQGRSYGFFGLGCDAVPAWDVREHRYPGFRGLESAGSQVMGEASPTSITSLTATLRSHGC